MFVYPHPDPVALSLGPLTIRWYGLMYLVGFLAAWWLARRRAAGPRSTWTPAEVDDLIFYCALGVILGGRLGWMLFYGTEQILAEPLSVLRVWEGGMSFHGGLLGVLVVLFLFSRKQGKTFLEIGDTVAPLVPLGLAAGRMGNFINGELWGRVTDGPFGVIFCNETIQANHPQHICPAGPLPRHPSQLYEAGLEGLALFLIMAFAIYRLKWLRRRGALVGTFLLGYGLARLSLENVRNPDIGMPEFPLGLTMGMMLSAPMILAGGWLLWKALKEPIQDEAEAREPA